jgi:O-antigen ligase
VGALQILGDPQGPLYFYDITHNGLPVGLFANRNHQAVFLVTLLPMLFAWVKLGEFIKGGADRVTYGWRFWPIMGGGAVLLLPLILMTGSRSGLAIALLALAILPLLALGLRGLASGDTAARFRWALWLLPLILVVLAGLSVVLGRALSVERLVAGADGEMRVLILPQVLAMIRDYLPLGTGMGTFEAVYQLHEPGGLLRSFYMNHVHDDWLELALTGGIPAILLVAMAVVAFAVRCVKLIRVSAGYPPAVLCGRLGAVVLVVFALASITDYPLRVPALSCLAAVAVLWMRSPAISGSREAHEKVR